MESENTYIGNIMKSTNSNNNEELIKEKAFLIKIGKDRYVDFDDIKNEFDYLILILTSKISSKVLTINATQNNALFVDENSLRPYSQINKQHIKRKYTSNR